MPDEPQTLGNIEPLRELFAKLVFRGDRNHLGAGLRKLGHDGVAAQQFGARHDDRLPGGRVEVEIARDAVLRGRRAGDDGHVVRAGERGHGTVGHRGIALAHEARDVGNAAVGEELAQVGRVAAVDAHHDHRPQGPAVGNAVHVHFRGHCSGLLIHGLGPGLKLALKNVWSLGACGARHRLGQRVVKPLAALQHMLGQQPFGELLVAL